MTQTEALKMALEVLKNTQDYKKGCAFVVEAAEDIAEVLLNSEQCKYGQEPQSCTSNPMDCQCAIDAALAQPEQEPVKWSDYELNGIHHKSVAWMDADGNVSDNNDHKCFPIPLYTTPPQRTWIGLMDEEIDVAWRSVDYTVPYEQFRLDVARAIEAKLKEKNT